MTTRTKYVKLNKEQTEWESALFSIKPLPVQRHPDEKLPEYDWYPVVEHKTPLTDNALYEHQKDSWEVLDGKVHIHYKEALLPLERRRSVLVGHVNTIRDRKLNGGLVFDGDTFQTDDTSIKRVLGAAVKAYADNTHTEDWITEDNKIVQMNNQRLIDFGNAFMQHERSHVMHARILKDTISSSDTPEKIDIHDGWPSIEYTSSSSK